jgi:formylglycine-generating enzyme required for sulfatase activity
MFRFLPLPPGMSIARFTKDPHIMNIFTAKRAIFVLLSFFIVGFSFAADANDADYNAVKSRIRNLKMKYNQICRNIDDSHRDQFNAIEKDFYLLINKAKQEMPEPPAPRDMFETNAEYIQRINKYKQDFERAEKARQEKIKKIKKDFNLRYYMSLAEVKVLKEKIQTTEPVIRELETIQDKKRTFDQGIIQVILFEPEPDKYRFPIHFLVDNERIQKYWTYTDRNKAREFWKNRSALEAVKLVQFEDNGDNDIVFKFTALRVWNPLTGDRRDFVLHQAKPFSEVSQFYDMKDEALPAAELMVALKDVVKGPVKGMQFIFISPRTFMMGSPRNEAGRWANETQHKVKLTQGFYMQTTEVTQGQWREVMGNNPSVFVRCGSDCPVDNVYWGEAMEFIDRLNRLEGTTKYRLPTEAEWEFACRAGSTQMGAFGGNLNKLGDYGWYKDNSEGTTHPVAMLNPNTWGLYDMHGNVSEWCSDWFGPYPTRDVTDPQGPYSGKFRVARGGNWFFPARSSRAADRNENLPGDRSEYTGFRVVKSP